MERHKLQQNFFPYIQMDSGPILFQQKNNLIILLI